MESTTYLLLLLLLVIGSTALGGVAWMCGTTRRLAAQVDALQGELSGLATSVTELAATLAEGQAGMAESVGDLARRTRTMEQRQDRVEMRDLDERRYSEAARLVQQGADSQNLVRNCGLTNGEADLVVRLHGARQSA